MLRFVIPVLLSVVWLVSGSSVVLAKRLALVIGNNEYETASDLKKAVNDAVAVGITLKDIGFETTQLINKKRRELSRAIYRFTSKIKEGDEVVFYYSGHGIAISGENYMLPVDVPPVGEDGEQFLANESISINRVIAGISQRKGSVSVFIIDACRNNPFRKSNGGTVGKSQGLVRIEAPAGTFVLFSAGYEQTAIDSIGSNDPNTNSVYTRSLIPLMKQPGLSLAGMAKQLRSEVETLAKSVRHNQYPAYYDQLRQSYYLVPASVVPSTNLTIGGGQQLSPDQALWSMVKNSKKHSDYAFYLRKFPKGAFSAVAHLKLKELGAIARKRRSAGSDGAAQSSLSAFAGVWRVSLTPVVADQASCTPFSDNITIKGSGSVSGAQTGRVASTGRIRLSRPCRFFSCEYQISGRLSGSSGRGKFDTTAGGCFGRVVMQKIN